MRFAAVAALVALGASSLSWAAESESAGYESVDRIHHFGRFDSWRVVDRDTLIVWTTPSRPYLIELKRGSPDLRFAQVIGVTTDALFPIRQQEELAAGLQAVVPDVEFVKLNCIKGHDSFLVEMDDFRPVIGRFFETFNHGP